MFFFSFPITDLSFNITIYLYFRNDGFTKCFFFLRSGFTDCILNITDFNISVMMESLSVFSSFRIFRLSFKIVFNISGLMESQSVVCFFISGITETQSALYMLQNEGFLLSRHNVPHVAIVITDGKSFHTTDTMAAAASAQAQGWKLFI